ncbi:Uncharacterised protein [Cedecea neteri]|uniref:Uncharacterized protein n=1 Tax=Cedecea neteri TaxID=158822 RepID=A0A2X3JAE4_9ENTR|nr:Uncharacterised protein [Cedecea neteri]
MKISEQVSHLQRSTDTFRIMTGLISIYGELAMRPRVI